MNPKISDFGMARIVQLDQDPGHTNKIAGTWQAFNSFLRLLPFIIIRTWCFYSNINLAFYDRGYMSPEYAMLGQYSEKSDIFSFGVIVLEIITGKRNLNPYESHHVTEGLASYVSVLT